jgi:hypothetical protein
MYELKTGSKLLYGRNYLNYNVVEPQDIPLWEGVKLLLNRMVESLSTTAGNKQSQYDLAKWDNKILTACGDVILLDLGFYHYSYRERMNRLAKLIEHSNYEFLCEKSYDLILEAYRARLTGNLDSSCEYRNDDFYRLIDGSFRYSIKKVFNISFKSYLSLVQKYLAKVKTNYSFQCYTIYGFSHALLDNIIYLTKLLKWGQKPTFGLVWQSNISWHHLIYSRVPLMYFFERFTKKEQSDAIKNINNILSLFNFQCSNDINVMKKQFLRLWFNICYGKNV